MWFTMVGAADTCWVVESRQGAAGQIVLAAEAAVQTGLATGVAGQTGLGAGEEIGLDAEGVLTRMAVDAAGAEAHQREGDDGPSAVDPSCFEVAVLDLGLPGLAGTFFIAFA